MIKRIHSGLLLCKNLQNTTEFYEQLGFTVDTSGGVMRIIFGDFRLAFMNESKASIETDIDTGCKGIGIFFYFEVEDIDSFFDSLKKTNIKTIGEPKDYSHGKREFTIHDPDGYRLVFFSNINS